MKISNKMRRKIGQPRKQEKRASGTKEINQ
jgi:hypothetical protein